MVTYREIPVAEAGFYDDIEMVAEIREIRRVETGDFGIRFIRQPVEPYEKDYRAFGGWADWKEKFDVSRWKVFCAFDGQTPVAGAVLCAGSAGVDMLEGRDDLGVLWDLRVDRRYKRRGIGSRLFALVADAAAASGCRQLKIECQNVNVPVGNPSGTLLSARFSASFRTTAARRRCTTTSHRSAKICSKSAALKARGILRSKITRTDGRNGTKLCRAAL